MNRLLAPCIILLSIPITAYLSYQLYKPNSHNVSQAQWELNIANEHMTSIAGGYDNALAIFKWISLIAYFGNSDIKTDHAIVFKKAMEITTLNAKSEHVYQFSAVILPWSTGSTVYSAPLTEKAIQEFPNAWRWPYYQGFNAYWFDDNTEKAAHYLQMAASKKDAPISITSLALRMHARANKLDTALIFLDRILKKEADPEILKRLLVQRNAILTEQILLSIDRLLATLDKRFNSTQDLNTLQQNGYSPPKILPDGGHIIFNSDGRIISSYSKKRFKIHIPPSRQKKNE